MVNVLAELFALKHTPWYRWHPQIALRYLPVVERIQNIKRSDLSGKGQTLTVLEVGSGGLGIAPYLRQPVTGVDVEFVPPLHPLLNRVVGSAGMLDFPTSTFDVVISIDMLEHIPAAERRLSINEMIRVARKSVVIGVPCGKESLDNDKIIQQDYRRRYHRGYKFAEEHIQLGLPDEDDILSYIKVACKKAGKKVNIEIVGNLNLSLRRFLMWGWLSQNLLINVIFRKVFLILIPLFRHLDRPPYYRQLFFVTIIQD